MTTILRRSTTSWMHLIRLSRPVTLALLAVLVFAPGCSSKKPKTKVTGKVTVDKNPVQGEIVFLSSEGKETAFGISNDGTYTALNLPVGKYQVAVRMPKGLGGAPVPGADGGGLVAPRDTGGIKDGAGGGLLGGTSAKNPPAGYNDAKTSGLEYEVVTGEQTKDFELDAKKTK